MRPRGNGVGGIDRARERGEEALRRFPTAGRTAEDPEPQGILTRDLVPLKNWRGRSDSFPWSSRRDRWVRDLETRSAGAAFLGRRPRLEREAGVRVEIIAEGFGSPGGWVTCRVGPCRRWSARLARRPDEPGGRGRGSRRRNPCRPTGRRRPNRGRRHVRRRCRS